MVGYMQKNILFVLQKIYMIIIYTYEPICPSPTHLHSICSQVWPVFLFEVFSLNVVFFYIIINVLVLRCYFLYFLTVDICDYLFFGPFC